jgi:hypothetical protein
MTGRDVPPGSTVWLAGGTYHGAFTSYLKGTSNAPITVRVLPGERAVLNGRGFKGPRQHTVLAVFGEWTNYIGLEITSSESDRSSIGSEFRQEGFDVFGPHVKIINFIVYNSGEGTGFWKEAVDSEVYGTIIFGCGSKNTPTDNRHGHGIYTQNLEGTKLITDNILFNNYGFGIHGWGKPKGTEGYQVEGNIIFNSGAQSGNGMRLANILFTGGERILVDRLIVANNYTYQTLTYRPTGDVLHDTNLCIACDNKRLHGSGVIRDNYFAGGAPILLTGKWTNLAVTGNTFIGSNGMVITADIANPGAWNRNSYYGRGYMGKSEALFVYNEKPYDFAGWQRQTRADGDSSYSVELPRNAVFVRPNRYEEGRAHIAVYNWEHAQSVDVDLSSAMAVGSQFEIRNAQDFFGAPVASGTYRGGKVRIPMFGLTVQAPLGDAPPPSTLPEFNAFVLLPTGKSANQYRLPNPGRPLSQDQPPEPRRTRRTDLERFVGTYYSLLPPGRVDVVNGEEGLRIVMSTEPDRPSFPLEPMSELKFKPEGAPTGSTLEFHLSGNRVVGATLVDGRGPVYNLKKK